MLLEQLGRRDPLVADIYVGGLRAFTDDANPYRLQLAAHAFRELIAHCLRMTGGKAVFGDTRTNRPGSGPCVVCIPSEASGSSRKC